MDERLFKVHRYHLIRESEVFNDMFSLPSDAAASGDLEGQNDAFPIVIPEITCAEMESFLGFMYFGYVRTCSLRTSQF